jgi:hypothetical protein
VIPRVDQITQPVVIHAKGPTPSASSDLELRAASSGKGPALGDRQHIHSLPIKYFEQEPRRESSVLRYFPLRTTTHIVRDREMELFVQKNRRPASPRCRTNRNRSNAIASSLCIRNSQRSRPLTANNSVGDSHPYTLRYICNLPPQKNNPECVQVHHVALLGCAFGGLASRRRKVTPF